MTELIAVRHDQASFDADDQDQLSPLGKEQAKRLGRWLAADRELVIDAVVVGAMRSHQQTLAAIEHAYAEARRNPPEAEIDPGCNEFDHDRVPAAFLASHPRSPLEDR